MVLVTDKILPTSTTRTSKALDFRTHAGRTKGTGLADLSELVRYLWYANSKHASVLCVILILIGTGGLIFLDLPMRPFVVIGTYEVANELLSGKSHIYSSRIKSVMIDLYVSTFLTSRRN